MAYYVLGPGGSKHGPAELHTLNEWIAEGRIAPETLIEDMGSGVKTPARAVRGLVFAGVTTPSPVAPGPTAMRPQAGTPLARPGDLPTIGSQQFPTSNYIRPGLGTGGSNRNLFLPGADAKWAMHGFLCAGGGLGLGLLVWLVTREAHYPIIRLTLLALGLCIYGVRCGFNGMNQGESGRGGLVIAVNVLAFLAVVGLMFWEFASW